MLLGEDEAGQIDLEANADRFSGDEGAEVLRRMAQLTASAVAAPETPLALLPLLSAEEHLAEVEGWNRTSAPTAR